MILSGSPVRTDNVELLASLLDGDELGVKLERAVVNKSSLVALSLDDRRRIVAVLAGDAPWGLAELRKRAREAAEAARSARSTHAAVAPPSALQEPE